MAADDIITSLINQYNADIETSPQLDLDSAIKKRALAKLALGLSGGGSGGATPAEIKNAIETATNLDQLETLIGLANASAITDPASINKSILGLLAGLLTRQTRRYRVGSEVVTGTTPKTYGSGATANLISISISVQSGSVAITGGATITASDPAVTFGNGSVSRLLDSTTPITLTGGTATDRYLVIWETEV